jgi:two-component system NtrC family sensor kinase
LGLSQVYGFVKQSGGHIRIYSEVGVGTTVKIYLPRSFANDSTKSPQHSEEVLRGNGESVLVVEDDASVRDYLIELLRELNYAAISANGGEAAIKVLSDPNQTVDLLLTDVVMPGMNGRQVAEAALAKRPDLKVLYMTGYSRNAIVHQGRLDPGVALIQKPISEQNLAMRLKAMLGNV